MTFSAEFLIVFTRTEEVNFEGSIVVWSVLRGLFDVLSDVLDNLIYHLKTCIQSGNHAFIATRVARVLSQGKAG